MNDSQSASWRPLSEEWPRTYQYVDQQGAVSHISVDEYRFEGVEIFSATSRQEREVRMNEHQETPQFNMYFSLEGCCGAYHNNRNKNYPIRDRQHTVSFTPQFDGYYAIESPTVRSFGIVLSEPFFSRLLVDDPDFLRGFWDRVGTGKPADLTPAAMPITPGQGSVIREMQQCPYAGRMKQLFFESKIIELFLLQAEQAQQLLHAKRPSARVTDKDKLYAARHFIQEHLFQSFTLQQVARNCGLNEFKLKKGFREQFGTTVFGYLTELKMEYGRQLLIDTACTVYEAAYLLGYSDPYNFSKAFRKQFGYLPSALKSAG